MNKSNQTSLLLIMCSVMFAPTTAYTQHIIEKTDYQGMAMLSSRMGKSKDAIMYWSKAIKKTPENYDLYVNRAGAYLAMKQPGKALADLDKVTALIKGKSVPPITESFFYSNKGSAYAALNRDEEALKCLEKSVSIFGMNAGAELSLAEIYAKRKQKELAIKHFNKARSLYPKDPSGKNVKFIDDEIAKLKPKGIN